MPLLDIVGFTATGLTFFIGFAFLKDEKQETYETALGYLAELFHTIPNQPYPRTILMDKERALMSVITTVFPDTKNILCSWHHYSNVYKKAGPILKARIKAAVENKTALPDKLTLPNQSITKAQLSEAINQLSLASWEIMKSRWNSVLYASTSHAFDYAWNHFQEHYSDLVFKPLHTYLKKEWLDDYPEHFLKLFTQFYLHLGQTSTSRYEGAHWLLKQDLTTSINDLLIVFINFARVINRQYHMNKLAIQNGRIRIPVSVRPLYRLLMTYISKKAIENVTKELEKYLPEAADKPVISAIYVCNSKDTAGTPYIHIIKQHLDESRGLKLNLFHQQWHLHKLSEAPLIAPELYILDPLPVRGKGRPRGAKNLIHLSKSSEVPASQGTTSHTYSQLTPSSLEPSSQAPSIQVPSSQPSLIPYTPEDPLTPFDRITQREPSGFEYVAQGPRGGLGGRGGRARARGKVGRPAGSGRGRGRGRGRGT
ncbi:uncharacterized protein N7503_001214 [Penicillium pulvis]|uniref:uncharacterized protein n=1 Tax=Penicillium pulvis TaxID=1562058 RepID=UPI0025483F48|nr:uncharacterized protein N7503_001214 [Penicillium pulvis]KAJ5814464.1 hypothetical protein N7503_001214 [Penicillium pulvis]